MLHQFGRHCASCHGADRLGSMGPALLPENLERLKKNEALEVISSMLWVAYTTHQQALKLHLCFELNPREPSRQ